MFIGVHPHYFLCLQTPSPRKEGWPVSVQISEIFCAGSRNTFRNFAWVLFVGGLLMINSWCHKMKQKWKLMDNCWGVFLQFLEGRYQFQIPKIQEENPLMTLKILNDSGKKKKHGVPNKASGDSHQFLPGKTRLKKKNVPLRSDLLEESGSNGDLAMMRGEIH